MVSQSQRRKLFKILNFLRRKNFISDKIYTALFAENIRFSCALKRDQ